MQTLVRLISGLVISIVLGMSVADKGKCEYGPWQFGPCNPFTHLKYGERRLLPGSDPECAPEVTNAVECVVSATTKPPAMIKTIAAAKPVVVSPQTVESTVLQTAPNIFTSTVKPSPFPALHLMPLSERQSASAEKQLPPMYRAPINETATKQAQCGPGVWVRQSGVRGAHYKMLALVHKGSAITKCQELCLKDNKCTSFDTVTISVATLCFGNPGPGPLVNKTGFSHWEYQVNCNTSLARVFIFHFLGTYYMESNNHCLNSQVSSLQECLSSCTENSSCVAGLYGDGSCCQVSNLEDVRLIKVATNGSQLFEKRPPTRPGTSKHPLAKKIDSCVPIEFGTEVVYPAWKNDQMCWSGKAKRECIYNYDRNLLKSTVSGNMTDQLLTKGSYEACLLLCTEMSNCYEADYLQSDSLCKINVDKNVEGWPDVRLSIRPDLRRWSYYTKNMCFTQVLPTTTTKATAPRLLSTSGMLSLMLGIHILF